MTAYALNSYGQPRELPARTSGDRVEIICGEYLGETGEVDSFFYGLGGRLVYRVLIDGRGLTTLFMPYELRDEDCE